MLGNAVALIAAVGSANLALAFSAGMASAVNPCGFALLPAYLTYFLGLENPDDETTRPTGNPFLRAVSVSVAMTAGFVVVFAFTGLIWSSIQTVAGPRLAWVTLTLGILIALAGVSMILGFQPVFNIPKLSISPKNQELTSIFLFGISYAVASLSCTLPIYISIVSTSFEAESFGSGLSSFVLYGIGMGSVVTLLTIAVSFANEGIVRWMRGLLPHMGKISGVLMILAGIFVSYYAWWEIQVLAANDVSDGLAGAATNWQSDLQGWISSTGEERLGVAVLLIVIASVVIGSVINRSGRQNTPPT